MLRLPSTENIPWSTFGSSYCMIQRATRNIRMEYDGIKKFIRSDGVMQISQFCSSPVESHPKKSSPVVEYCRFRAILCNPPIYLGAQLHFLASQWLAETLGKI